MDECELVAFISSIACIIAKCSSDDDITILAVAFTQLGDTLSTIIAKRGLSANTAKNKAAEENEQNNSEDCKKDDR